MRVTRPRCSHQAPLRPSPTKWNEVGAQPSIVLGALLSIAAPAGRAHGMEVTMAIAAAYGRYPLPSTTPTYARRSLRRQSAQRLNGMIFLSRGPRPDWFFANSKRETA